MSVILTRTNRVYQNPRPSNIYEVVVILRDNDGFDTSKSFWGGYDYIVPRLQALSAFLEITPFFNSWSVDIKEVFEEKGLDLWDWYENFVGHDLSTAYNFLNKPVEVMIFWYDECNGDKYSVKATGLTLKRKEIYDDSLSSESNEF